MPKKGSAMMNFLVAVGIGLMVLAAAVMLISKSAKGESGTSSIKATSFCLNLCMQDRSALPAGINLTERLDSGELRYEGCIDSSKEYGNLASKFCNGHYYIEGKKTPCYEITTCKLVDNFGGTCVASCGQSGQT